MSDSAAPHKFKGGVSGCVRECAEAQSKDFGLIATDKGWNSTSRSTKLAVVNIEPRAELVQSSLAAMVV